MKVVFDYYDGVPDGSEANVADEMRRVADLIEQDFREGELVEGSGRGWWQIEHD